MSERIDLSKPVDFMDLGDNSMTARVDIVYLADMLNALREAVVDLGHQTPTVAPLCACRATTASTSADDMWYGKPVGPDEPIHLRSPRCACKQPAFGGEFVFSAQMGQPDSGDKAARAMEIEAACEAAVKRDRQRIYQELSKSAISIPSGDSSRERTWNCLSTVKHVVFSSPTPAAPQDEKPCVADTLKKHTTTDATEILWNEFYKDNPERLKPLLFACIESVHETADDRVESFRARVIAAVEQLWSDPKVHPHHSTVIRAIKEAK